VWLQSAEAERRALLDDWRAFAGFASALKKTVLST
jgi:hypothetical protein